MQNHSDQQTTLDFNQEGWNKIAPQFYDATALPDYGPFTPSEDELHLLGDFTGKRILEIGCGSGHSLLYAAQKGASELWGLDLSQVQLDAAKRLLADHSITASLHLSPMEENPGLSTDYFDIVFSLFALGWTVNLPQTLSHIASYLKPGGHFLFSWEHPAYSCLSYSDGQMIMKRPYIDETQFTKKWHNDTPITRFPRKLSTYINAMVDAGFAIDRLIEESSVPEQDAQASNEADQWYSSARAQWMPPAFIIKAVKMNS